MKMVKNNKEIEIMKISGKIASHALKKVLENIKPGARCIDFDAIAPDQIESYGASPSFMTVDDYKWTICTTVNDQVVHGIPNGRKLTDGDILGVDIGALYKGYHSDVAISVPVGKVSASDQKFLDVGKKTLKEAIAKEIAAIKPVTNTNIATRVSIKLWLD